MNKLAVITGAGKGLGLELTRCCLKDNYTVIAIDKSITSDIEMLSNTYGKMIVPYQVDITDHEKIKECALSVSNKYQCIDLLINNAGIWLDFERKELEDSDFDFDMCTTEFNVNAMGTLRMTKAFLPFVKQCQNENRAIINISSDCASSEPENTRTSEYAYCMSKACVNIISNILNNSLKKTDIKVLSVFPGWMQTDMGYAGPGNPQPNTPPKEAAECILKLIKQPKKNYVFCDRFGNRLH